MKLQYAVLAALVAVAVMLLPAPAKADSIIEIGSLININYYEAHNPWGGGPFQLSQVGGVPVPFFDSFLTFCVDRTVTFTPGSTVYEVYDISDTSSVPSHQLTPEADWLFYNYSAETIVHAMPNEERWGLQWAIWRFTGNATHGDLEALSNAAIRTAALDFEADAILNAGDYGTKILKLKYYTSGHEAQAQLAITGGGHDVPEPSLLILLGFGLSGLGLAIRKRRI